MEVKGTPGMVSHGVRKTDYSGKGTPCNDIQVLQATTQAHTRIVFCIDWITAGMIFLIPSGTGTG